MKGLKKKLHDIFSNRDFKHCVIGICSAIFAKGLYDMGKQDVCHDIINVLEKYGEADGKYTRSDGTTAKFKLARIG